MYSSPIRFAVHIGQIRSMLWLSLSRLGGYYTSAVSNLDNPIYQSIPMKDKINNAPTGVCYLIILKDQILAWKQSYYYSILGYWPTEAKALASTFGSRLSSKQFLVGSMM